MTPLIQFAGVTDTHRGWAYHLPDLTERHVRDLRTATVNDCRNALRDHGQPVDDDALFDCAVVVAELLTNVLRHAVTPGRRGRADVIIVLEDTDLLLTVIDSSRQGPLMDTTSPGQEENGLGLRLVGTLTRDRWGWYRLAEGKAVWARCPTATQTEPDHGTTHQPGARVHLADLVQQTATDASNAVVSPAPRTEARPTAPPSQPPATLRPAPRAS